MTTKTVVLLNGLLGEKEHPSTMSRKEILKSASGDNENNICVVVADTIYIRKIFIQEPINKYLPEIKDKSQVASLQSLEKLVQDETAELFIFVHQSPWPLRNPLPSDISNWRVNCTYHVAIISDDGKAINDRVVANNSISTLRDPNKQQTLKNLFMVEGVFEHASHQLSYILKRFFCGGFTEHEDAQIWRSAPKGPGHILCAVSILAQLALALTAIQRQNRPPGKDLVNAASDNDLVKAPPDTEQIKRVKQAEDALKDALKGIGFDEEFYAHVRSLPDDYSKGGLIALFNGNKIFRDHVDNVREKAKKEYGEDPCDGVCQFIDDLYIARKAPGKNDIELNLAMSAAKAYLELDGLFKLRTA